MKYELVNYHVLSEIVCAVDEKGDLVKKFDNHKDWKSNYDEAKEWLENQK